MIQFLKKETVLVLSLIAAIVTLFFVPPSIAYLQYFDFRVLALLFCLMAVVAGWTKAGIFDVLSQKLTGKITNFRLLSLILVWVCFFSSMFITNDVALLTFVPFALSVLTMVKQPAYCIYIVSLQTIAANLGSMFTPIGNPQNLYLYSFFGLNPASFFKIMFPLSLLGLGVCTLLPLLVKKESIEVHFQEAAHIQDKRRFLLHTFLFLLCLLTVFRILPYFITLGVILASLLLFDRPIFKKVDYSLLLTFVCFFIFVGNLGKIPAIQTLLKPLLQGREMLCAIGLSQVMSNVPTAVMLSAFTDNAEALLLGTNIGGLGTLIASLASLISFKIYIRSTNAKPFRYLCVFTVLNFILLAVFTLAGNGVTVAF